MPAPFDVRSVCSVAGIESGEEVRSVAIDPKLTSLRFSIGCNLAIVLSGVCEGERFHSQLCVAHSRVESDSDENCELTSWVRVNLGLSFNETSCGGKRVATLCVGLVGSPWFDRAGSIHPCFSSTTMS